MRSIIFFILIFSFAKLLFAQSSVVYEAGTIIEVQAGADFCADNVTIQGTYTGTGTLCNGPLPVELTLFTAKVKDNKVNLYWKTETEVNNFGFDIERKTNEGGWYKISFVKGNGNSNSPKEYFYTDDKLIGGSKFQYRLKQVDNDGQFEYSDIVEVEIIPDKFALFQNYPNPFNPSTIIRYQIPKESKVNIKIYDVLGAQIMELVNETKVAGVYEVVFDAKNLTSGTYIYRITANLFVENKKMILLR
jgi:hypothetical protein